MSSELLAENRSSLSPGERRVDKDLRPRYGIGEDVAKSDKVRSHPSSGRHAT